MNTSLRCFAALTLCLASACFVDVDVESEVEGRMRLEVELGGECAGDGEITSELGVTTYTKTLEDDGAVCRIDLVYDGVLVDVPAIRADIEADGQVEVKDVTVTRMDIDLVTAALADKNGKTVNPPLVPYWSAEIEAEGEQLLALEREGVSRLVDETIALEVGDALVDRADHALHDDEVLKTHAVSTLRVFTADLEALQAVPGPVGVQIDLVTTVGATAKVHPLRR